MGPVTVSGMTDAVHDMFVAIEAATRRAAHRRDHTHTGAVCEPHCVEEVWLGNRAFFVCHDCGAEGPLVDVRRCHDDAVEHQNNS